MTIDESAPTAPTQPMLSDAHLNAWRRDGYLHLTGVLSAAVAADLDRWAAELEDSDDDRLLQHHEATEHGAALARTEQFVDVHDGFRELALGECVAGVGAQLIGEPLALYKEKINHKRPGGGGFAAHQDATAYPFIDSHVTCMIAIDPATAGNGCVEVASGRHEHLIVDDGDGCLPESVVSNMAWTRVEMASGDMLWFHSRTPHRSGDNRSDRPRRAVFLTFNAASEGDRRDDYYAEKRRHLADHDGDGAARVSTIGHFQGKPVRTAPMTPWRELTSPVEVARSLIGLYETKGGSHYDEVVTQTSHALQSGQLAMDAGAPPATILAAFLHDVGHLLLDEHDEQGDFLGRDLHHEDVGARFLANWFDADVTEPIRLHVPAKRYLCAVDPAYHDGLSAASVRSLGVQGGSMSETEVEEFESLAGYEAAVDLRRWDDLAKVPGAPVPSLDSMATLIESVAVIR